MFLLVLKYELCIPCCVFGGSELGFQGVDPCFDAGVGELAFVVFVEGEADELAVLKGF